MAKRFGDQAIDFIWIIVTVSKTSTTVRLIQREMKAKTLAPNEYAYKFKITTDFKKWDDRMVSVELPQVNPPVMPSMMALNRATGRSIEERVTEVLTQ